MRLNDMEKYIQIAILDADTRGLPKTATAMRHLAATISEQDRFAHVKAIARAITSTDPGMSERN